MDLYTLYYGKSKHKLKPIMTSSKEKCLNYQKARKHTVKGFHEILPAEKGEKEWKQKSSTIGGNKCEVPRINRHGKTTRNGWIGKNGFNEHT